MLDYFFGLLLLGLGIHTPARQAVLGETSTTTEEHISPTVHPTGGLPTTEDHRGSNAGESGDSRSAITTQRPLIKSEIEAFQKERKLREEKIRTLSTKRSDELEKNFLDTQKNREREDEASRAAFARKIAAFKNIEKQKKASALGTAYQTAITNVLTSIQKKLTSMLTLLDKISVAAATLQQQGKDVAKINEDITEAQAKVTTATTLLKTITSNLPTSLTVTGESTASKEISTSIVEARKTIELLYKAFSEARKSVGVALEDLEALTKTVDVTPTPK